MWLQKGLAVVLSQASSRGLSPESTEGKHMRVTTDRDASTRRAGRLGSNTGGTTKLRTYVLPDGQLLRPYVISGTYVNWLAQCRRVPRLTTFIVYTARRTCIIDLWCKMTRQIWRRRSPWGWISPWTIREPSVRRLYGASLRLAWCPALPQPAGERDGPGLGLLPLVQRGKDGSWVP